MMTEEQVERTFVVGETPRLSVANVRGSITVQGEERADIQVTAVKRRDDRGDPDRTEVQMYQEGERVVVKTRHRDEDSLLGRLRGAHACAVDYTVRVPTHCATMVSQVNGTIHVSGLTDQVKVNAVQGTVKLREIAGRTRVHTVSAMVEGEGWRGRAQVDTVSGPVQVSAAQLSRFTGNTVSGDLSLETAVDDQGRYDFHSVSGDVTFYLPPQRGLDSRGTTISGRLRCELPHEFTHRGRGGWRATINGGGPPLRFNSVSGDLEVLAVEAA
jgi:hypothetical protein